MSSKIPPYPSGYEVFTYTRMVPTPPPPPDSGGGVNRIHWRIAVSQKINAAAPPAASPTPTEPHGPARQAESEITVQLTADQQVELTITGEDRYGNPVDISGDIVWSSSDNAIVQVEADDQDSTTAYAKAVGPIGTAAVTVSNDTNSDGTGDFQGSLAIDVVAGEVAEIAISEGTPEDKLEVNPLPGA